MAMTVVLLLVLTGGCYWPGSVAAEERPGPLVNPATLGVGPGISFAGYYSAAGRTAPGPDAAVALAAGPFAFAWEAESARLRLGSGFGSRAAGAGIQYRREKGYSALDVGLAVRPARWVAVGAVWHSDGQSRPAVEAGLAFRPLRERLTLWADVAVFRSGTLSGSFGAELRPVNGLAVAAALRPATTGEVNLSAGLRFDGSHVGFGAVGAGATSGGRPAASVLTVRASVERRPTVFAFGRRYLEIELAGTVAETQAGFIQFDRSRRSMWQLTDWLERAAQDKSVAGVLLRLNQPRLAAAQIEELRAALLRLRQSGRKVMVYATEFSTGSYWLASAADLVACHPAGGVAIEGFAAQALLVKGAIDKLDLVFQSHRHGRYKSAIEMFTEDSISPANREQLGQYLDAVYGAFRDDLAAGRGLSKQQVDSLVEIAWFDARSAMTAGLIDTLIYHDEVESAARRLFGRGRRVTESAWSGERLIDDRWGALPVVAVVPAVGTIVAGRSGTDILTGSRRLGAQTISKVLRAIRRDRRVKAVVLRIDSPGGDGLASEIIWREIELLRKKKPVVVSMAGTAASGGYYIACNANRIWCSRTTLTGSIGVFDYGFVTEGLLNRFGVRRDVVKRGSRADARLGVRQYTPAEDSLIQKHIDGFYDRFVEKVATGRGLSTVSVDSVAQGRIWAGSDACVVGLADSLGGLRSALNCARVLAGLDECEYRLYQSGGFAAEFSELLAQKAMEVLLR